MVAIDERGGAPIDLKHVDVGHAEACRVGVGIAEEAANVFVRDCVAMHDFCLPARASHFLAHVVDFPGRIAVALGRRGGAMADELGPPALHQVTQSAAELPTQRW